MREAHRARERIMNTAVKVCSTCKKSKDVKEFYAHSVTSDGLYPYCKQCHAEYYETDEWRLWKAQYIKERKEGKRRRQTTPVEECLYEDCTTGSYAKGYCFVHYSKLLRGTLGKKFLCECSGEQQWLDKSCIRCLRKRQRQKARLVRQKRRRVLLETQPDGRTCTECNTWKVWEDFYKNNSSSGRMSKCKKCMIARQTERNNAHKNSA